MAGEAPCGDTGGRQIPCPVRLGMGPLRNAHLESTAELPRGTLSTATLGQGTANPGPKPCPASKISTLTWVCVRATLGD